MSPPELRGIHHLKLPVSNLDAALHFYQLALNAERIDQFDHRRSDDGSLYAYILKVPGLGTVLELRLHPEHAEKHRGFDSVTLSVDTLDTLQSWDALLTKRGVRHSAIIAAIYAGFLFSKIQTATVCSYTPWKHTAPSFRRTSSTSGSSLRVHVETSRAEREVSLPNDWPNCRTFWLHRWFTRVRPPLL